MKFQTACDSLLVTRGRCHRLENQRGHNPHGDCDDELKSFEFHVHLSTSRFRTSLPCLLASAGIGACEVISLPALGEALNILASRRAFGDFY